MAKGNEKKKGRRAYLDDIHPNLAGEYVYTGAYYRFNSKGISFGRARAVICLLAALSLLAVISAGCVNALGMGGCIYVLVPYMAEAIAAFTLAWAVGKLLFGGERLREYVYGSSVLRIPTRAVCTAAFAAAGTVCIIIYIIINGIDAGVGEIILLAAAKAVGIAAPLFLRNFLGGLKWEKEA